MRTCLAAAAGAGLLAAALSPWPVLAADQPASPAETRAGLVRAKASRTVRDIAGRAVHAHDHEGLPFIIVDKAEAAVFVFDGDGRLQGAAPALLGLAIGDDAVPGIGQRPLSAIRPQERTTPAGRFVAALDRNLAGREVLWVDYDNAISLHPVVTGKPSEQRLRRLASRTVADNRISYGCINVAQRFFDDTVSPLFRKHGGIVYVLPETRPARLAFGAHHVETGSPEGAGGRPRQEAAALPPRRPPPAPGRYLQPRNVPIH